MHSAIFYIVAKRIQVEMYVKQYKQVRERQVPHIFFRKLKKLT
jgi:hypothetical protein